jgi:transcriptional regulator with XRE-family HTH domain
MENTYSSVPIPLLRIMRKFGHDIRDARLRRRLPIAVVAERASISRTTVNKIEKGDPGVSFGIYARVLFVMGLADRLADLADPRHDRLGLRLEEERLPKRIRLPRQQESAQADNRSEA